MTKSQERYEMIAILSQIRRTLSVAEAKIARKELGNINPMVRDHILAAHAACDAALLSLEVSNAKR